jgi:uncharacterized membrane protein
MFGKIKLFPQIAEKEDKNMSKSRLESFTDAVIAIVMTLLVLELATPSGDTWNALHGIENKILIYVISFLSLAIYWNNHHHLFQVVKKIDGRVLWANNFFIFTLTFFPFATAWVGDHVRSQAPEITYGIVMLAADFSYWLLLKVLLLVNGKDSLLAKAFQSYRKMHVTLAINVLGILLGFFIEPLLVLCSIIVILIIWFIPEKRIENIL